MRLAHAVRTAIVGIVCLGGFAATAADYPAPKEGDWVARDFKFHTGDVMPELRLHYRTIGDPSHEAVIILHGTTGSGVSMLTPAYAGELLGPGQPLDASKYFIVLPDAVGHGKSSKPSDGMRTKFPRYNYDDMVAAQYRLVTEGLGIRHARLVTGNSMGGMNTWLWGEAYPDFMDALAPMAAQPTEMASRNWMMRRLITDAIRTDPDWHDGNYTTQPRSAHFASVFFGIATSGGTLGYQKLAPTRAAADKLLDDRMAAPFAADANDVLYQWDSSRDYDASKGLQRIQAVLLAINSADDERNPPETGLMKRALKQVKHGKLYLIPASDETRGHGTTGMAKFYKAQLAKLLQTAPHRGSTTRAAQAQ
jgi:homoserine O-acetyltransferase/O-succinyltransferase